MKEAKDIKEWQEIQEDLKDLKPKKGLKGFFIDLKIMLFGDPIPPAPHIEHSFIYGEKYKEHWTKWKDENSGEALRHYIRYFQDRECSVCGLVQKKEVDEVEDD